MAAMSAGGRLAVAFAAVTVLVLPLGTVYAFSVFIPSLEAELGLSRAELSGVFGLALVCFTLGMNAAPLLYRRAGFPWLVLESALVAGAGMAVASMAEGLWQLALGYGVLFGLGGGAGYVLLLQAVNLLVTARQGLANGYMISLYPIGAMLGTPVFGWALAAHGLRPTLVALGLVIAGAGVVAAGLAVLGRLVAQAPTTAGAEAAPPPPARRGLFALLWVVFFLAAAAGLTVLGQAAAMLRAYGAEASLALLATTGITGVIAGARIGGGWLADRFSPPAAMALAHGIALAGDALLLALPGPWMAVLCLGLIGLGYGIVSGSSAAALAEYWGKAAVGRMAARLYIAWCMAAVTLPVVAGRLFDLTGGYGGAIGIAALGNALGLVLALRLPRKG